MNQPDKQGELARKRRRFSIVPPSEEEARMSGRPWLHELVDAGWNPWSPNAECQGRTSWESFDFGESPLSEFDREAIYWRTVVLELIWHFGYGTQPPGWVNDWLRAGVLFVLQHRGELNGMQYGTPDALALYTEVDEWYVFRFVPALRRLNRCERVFGLLMERGDEAGARKFASRWLSSCEPALTAEAVRLDRPHLHLLDQEILAGLDSGFHQMAQDNSGFKNSEHYRKRKELDPRVMLNFLAYAGGRSHPRPIVSVKPSGEPAVLHKAILDAMRSTLGDTRKRTIAEKYPAKSVHDLVRDDADDDPWDELALLSDHADTIDALDRTEAMLVVLNELDAEVTVGTAKAAVIHDYIKVFTVEGHAPRSLSELAKGSGFHESTLRQARDEVVELLVRRLTA